MDDKELKIKYLEVEIKALEYFLKYYCAENDEYFVKEILSTKYIEFMNLNKK